MVDGEAHEVRFQCLHCGHDLKQTGGSLKASEPIRCSRCGIGINIDTNGLAHAVAYLLAADNVSGPLPIRLREVKEPVISTRNRFSRPRPRLLTCI